MPKSVESSSTQGVSQETASSHAFFSSRSRWWKRSHSLQQGWRGNVLAFVILVVISFVMLWLGDKLSSQGMAITRYMATIQAPVAGKFYPEHNRDAITVLAYDDTFMRSQGAAWPIAYGDHADWLRRIVESSDAKPKAIFLDITFTQQYKDPSLSELQSVLCELQNEQGIPVFLAALLSPVDGKLHLRPDLEATKDEQGRSCFTLVGVDSLEDPIDKQSWSYPLSSYIANKKKQQGPATDDTTYSYRSAAMAMAQDVAQLDLGPETEPMALVWGVNTPEQAELPVFLAGCRKVERRFSFSAPPVLRQLWEDEPPPPICPFHDTLSMVDVATMDEQALEPYVAGRYLMIAAVINGYNDMAYSPVHGLVPGVFVHAMALDNLLTYGNAYKQHSEWSLPPSLSMFMSGVVAIAAVFVIHLGFRWVRVRLRGQRWFRQHLRLLLMSTEEREAASLGTRLLSVPFRLAGWVLRILLQATAAVVLIAYMQWQFRLGMLPIVELIGMTILAEGLDYMDKVRAFLFGSAATDDEAVSGGNDKAGQQQSMAVKK